MSLRARLADAVSSWALTPTQREHLARVRHDDAGHGWDRFGMSVPGVGVGLSVLRHLYDFYFRVQSHGAHHIPKDGPTIVAANHSGMLPLDAMMLWVDILLQTDPPRVARPVADYFVPQLPFINILFARGGMLSGSRGNVHAALEAGELLEIFPEGVRGIGKPFSQRYQLQQWNVGHVELAIRHRAAVVPTAIIGAEESWPQATKLDVGLFGIPYLPVPATPLPMPTRFHVYYGAPLDFTGDFAPTDADDPSALRVAADRVRAAVAGLLARGLAERRGVFR